MKKLSIIASFLILSTILWAQKGSGVTFKKGNNVFVYHIYEYESNGIDTSFLFVKLDTKNKTYEISSPLPKGKLIPGYSNDLTVVDYPNDSVTYRYFYPNDNETYWFGTSLSKNIEWKKNQMPDKKTKYTCSINSNTLEFVMMDSETNINPMPNYGNLKGILTEYWRNGQLSLKLVSVSKEQFSSTPMLGNVQKVSPREMSRIKQSKMILTTRVFDQEQICWGKSTPSLNEMPFDSVIHFAGGTLILKRINLPVLPEHYSTFIELHQQSNGDAYDRTGSVFVIPTRNQENNFFSRGVNMHPDSLPIFLGKDGSKFQGIIRQEGYVPPVELMRFFTPFGVHHFNDRLQLEGIEWEDETYYKQDVTDLKEVLQGEVMIGAFIGNYDGGGHKVTLDIKSYPNDSHWEITEMNDSRIVPLFNTCNVLEMAGQNYGRLFGTDSVFVSFNIPEDVKNVKLRYITTGHGGWGGGDEFNPKTNTIILDGGEQIFHYTPWREDCGTFRKWNPVSGNFWNGVSSCDYSRSGWCPGTATQPTYFELGKLTPGTHTITIAIPQGESMEGSFSHWNVSGVLILE